MNERWVLYNTIEKDGQRNKNSVCVVALCLISIWILRFESMQKKRGLDRGLSLFDRLVAGAGFEPATFGL